MTVIRLVPRRRAAEPEPRRLIACRVRVRMPSGPTYCYHALVNHTCTAAIDALDYFGQCGVSVARCDLQPVDEPRGLS